MIASRVMYMRNIADILLNWRYISNAYMNELCAIANRGGK